MAGVGLRRLREWIPLDDRSPFLGGPDEDSGLGRECALELGLESPFQRTRCLSGRLEYQVAALEQRLRLPEADPRGERPELRHRDRLLAAEVHPAEQRDVAGRFWHRG